jgi:hypothetical protein
LTRRVAISGASGLVGAALASRLEAAGRPTIALVRDPAQRVEGATVPWSPEKGILAPERLEGVGAIVHLAGENIAGGRWSERRKERIRRSRVDATRKLIASLASLKRPPLVFLCASASGYYGDRGAEQLDEGAAAGSGFLAEVCVAWEEAAASAASLGARVASLRFGTVLSARGGALAKMLPLFRLGLGGRLGNGEQYFPWLAIDDVCGAILHVLDDASLAGAINLTAPEAVTNAQFTRALGRVLGRPTLVPAPAWALRLALGGLADEALLASTRVVPRRLEESGFPFRHPELEGALHALLSPP